ncbi:hypothetical protein [Nonomuraea jiangxiensis]|uniref:hypothetical protein n=1 Tax=Nonomuraea jiangxiensis TaxID=633440 RepID=UPI0015A1B4D7|nr:hypothetical protein [Nonomuraea jiangxiensis]
MGQPAGQWADDTDRALRTKWDDPKKLEAMLKGVPAGERRTWWVQQLVRYAGERTATFHLAVDARRRELAEQMFALLQAMEPRPAEAEVARPTAEFRSMVAGLAPASTAGRDLLAMAADIDAALTEVVDRAPTLDELRTGRIVQLTSACEGPRTDLAHVDQIVAGLTAMDTPALAKAFVELDVNAPALQALRAAIPDERHVGDQADQALRGKLDRWSICLLCTGFRQSRPEAHLLSRLGPPELRPWPPPSPAPPPGYGTCCTPSARSPPKPPTSSNPADRAAATAGELRALPAPTPGSCR